MELYKRISQEKAKEMMDTIKDCIILDVSTKDEFEIDHIKEADNIPNEQYEKTDKVWYLIAKLDYPYFYKMC